MEDRFIEDDLRSRLILAGTKELSDHGVRDFSLRRVAIAAQVSCAAPYRHFKDKEELILAIVSKMLEDWNLLSEQISEVFMSDKKRLLIELCVAGVRFWNGGENFRSVLMSGIKDSELLKFDIPIIKATTDFSKEKSLSEEETENLIYTVRMLLYGCVTLISAYSLSVDVCILNLRDNLLEKLSKY